MAQEERTTQRVLVADSEVLVRHGIAEYLRHCGYDVIEAATYEEALAVVSDAALLPEAILSDIELSGEGNGFTLRAWMRERHPHITVILAGNIEAATKAAGELCDEGPHFARPYEPQAVAEFIRRMLGMRNAAPGGD